MTRGQKHGALLFFGKANCVACHAVAGSSNEMFSDFQPHRIGGPQLAPAVRRRHRQHDLRRSGEDEDFGFEQTEGDPALRYTFRTAPLRNLKVAPAFFHNGAFGTLEAAIAHHLDVEASLRRYDPRANGVPDDLSVGPLDGILVAGIDPLLRHRSARPSASSVTSSSSCEMAFSTDGCASFVSMCPEGTERHGTAAVRGMSEKGSAINRGTRADRDGEGSGR